MKTLPLAKPSE